MEHRRSPTAYNFDTDIEFPSLGAEMENITEGQKNRQKEAESSGDFSHFSFISRIPVKALVLGLLVVQNSALAICMRYSRMRREDNASYAVSTAVVSCEFMKMIISTLFLGIEEGGVEALIVCMRKIISNNLAEMLKMAVPAILYTVQNIVAYVAVSHLDGPTYQLLYQGKIITTAIFSVILQNTKLSVVKWMSLCTSAISVGTVQISTSTSKTDGQKTELIGLISILFACLSSGFAGVFFEGILKHSTVSVWVRNIQLASYGVIVGLMGAYMGPDRRDIKENGFFYSYSWTVWGSVALNSGGGIIVALVLKYADNLTKCFATSLSIILTSVRVQTKIKSLDENTIGLVVISVVFLGMQINEVFMLGASAVVLSTFVYSGAIDISKFQFPTILGKLGMIQKYRIHIKEVEVEDKEQLRPKAAPLH